MAIGQGEDGTRRVRRGARGPAGLLLGIIGLLLVTATGRAEEDGRPRLAADFIASLGPILGQAPLPEADRARGAKCMVAALVADIPGDAAARLANMVERKAPIDPDLVRRWMVIEEGDNPDRHAQVAARVHEFRPDLEDALMKTQTSP